jgi:hypothetical protein
MPKNALCNGFVVVFFLGLMVCLGIFAFNYFDPKKYGTASNLSCS